MPKGRLTMEERLLAKREIAPSGCWIWTGYLNAAGYATVVFEGRTQGVHRVAYRLWVGPIPEGFEVDHLCVTPACFNPGHLEAVTPRTNLDRSRSPATLNRAKTHCRNGHAYDAANTLQDKRGFRVCRACARDRMRKNHRESRGIPVDAPLHWRPDECRNGHAYSEENTVYRAGVKRCRTCERERLRRYNSTAERRAYHRERARKYRERDGSVPAT